MLIQTRCMLGCLSGASGMFLNPWFRWAALQPDSGYVFSLSCEVKAISFLLFLLLCPSRSRTGLRTPGGDWRIRWGSRTWAGRWGSNCTTNMSRATQRGWASVATTAAQKVRLQPWRRFPRSGFRRGLSTLDDSPSAKITAGLLKVTPDLHRLLNQEPKKVALQH